MNLVLFCDYGLDDAVATVDALSHAEADGYESVALVAVGGNVPADVALQNAAKLIARVRFPHPKTVLVDTTAYPQPAEFLKKIHGDDGMGGLFPPAEPTCPVLSFDAFLSGLSDFVLLSLGPMTLLPYALEKGPARLIFMGGNIGEVPNFGDYEFNHALNRAAFSECVKVPHVAITMDTCRHPLLNLQEREIEGDGLLRTLVRRTREMTFVSGEKGCYVWDDIAVKYLRHPDWFETYEATDRDGNALTVARYILGKRFEEVLDD